MALDAYDAKLEKIRRLQEEHLRYYKPNPVQLAMHKSQASKRGLFAANQSGKSFSQLMEMIMTVGKVHPWRPNKTGIVMGRLCCQDVSVIEATILPTLKRIIPREECVLRGYKYTIERGKYAGTEIEIPNVTFEGKPKRFAGLLGGDFDKAYDKQNKVLTFADGSFIEIKTYEQDLQSYAGPPRDIIGHDEEPPEDKYRENVARQVTRGINLLFAMTPLNYSQWLYAEIYSQAVNDKNIDIFQMSAYDNPTADYDALAQLEASIADPAERAARMHGAFTYLEGLVYKGYGDHNYIEPFAMPKDWHRTIVIDPHPAKPTAVSWFAEDFDGKVYCYREAQIKGDIDEVCNEIKALSGGDKIDDIFCDPACKGQKTEWGKQSIYFDLQQHFPRIQLANNDVNAGIEKVKRMVNNKQGSGPRFFVFKTCPETDWQMRNLSWKGPTKTGEDRRKPEVVKKKDDLADNVRYKVMTIIEYKKYDDFKGFGIVPYAS